MSKDPIIELQEEIAKLNKRVQTLEQLIRMQVTTGQKIAPPEPPTSEPSHPFDLGSPPPIASQPPEEIVSTVTLPEPSKEPAPPRPDVESQIGGSWLNKIGAVALVLGFAFFLKYAFDNGWVNETGKIIIGLIAGLACIQGGEHFQKKKLPTFAQGLTGAGIAMLYFTIYASFAFYNPPLVPQLPAFAFMVVVTAAAIALSVRYDAVAIAILGIIGGFLTPALLSGGGAGSGGSQISVLIYIAVLDMGILGVTYFKGWRELNALSLVGTVLIFFGWLYSNYNYSMLWTTMFFLTLFYGIFAAQAFIQNVIARRSLNTADVFLAIAPPIIYFAAGSSLLSLYYRAFLGGFAIIISIVYILFARQVQAAKFEDRKLMIMFLGVAAGFLTLAIPIQFWKMPIAITCGWAAEAAVLAAIGFYVDSKRTRMISLAILSLAVFLLLRFLDEAFYRTDLTPIMNERFLTILFVIAIMVLVAWLYSKYRQAVTDSERGVIAVLVVGANVLMIWALSLEVTGIYAYHIAPGQNGPYVNYGSTSAQSLALTGVWTIYAIILLMVGISIKYRAARLLAVTLLGLVILKSFLYDVWTLDRLYRIIAFVGLGLMLLIASYFYQAYQDRIRQIVSEVGGKDEK